MAIISVSTASALTSALGSAAGGDIIEVAPGTYGSIIRTAARTVSTPITVRPSNRANPPIFTGTTAPSSHSGDVMSFFFQNYSGLVFDGLHIQGPTVSSGPNYPLMKETAFYMLSCSNITWRDCSFFDNMRHIYFNGHDNHNILIERTFHTRCGMDGINFYGDGSNITVQNVDMRAHRPDPARVNESGRHPDGIQFGCLDGYFGYEDVTIQDNRVETWQGYEQQIFCNNARINAISGTPTDAQFNSFGFRNFNIRRNFIIGFHQHGILCTGHSGGSITGNKITKLVPTQTNDLNVPTISTGNAQKIRNVSITNNVTPRAILLSSAPGSTFSGNVTSTTASPVGWVNPTVGPYSNTTETDPTQLTNATTHAHISGTFNAGVVSGVQYYGGRLVVPPTCPSYTSNPALTTYEWNDGNTTPEPTVTLTVDGSKTITAPGSGTSLEDYLVEGGNIPWSTRIQVLLPPNYDESLAGGYGVLYALPGQSASYDVFTHDMGALRIALTTKPMIVVTYDADIVDDGIQTNGCQGWYIDSPTRPSSQWLSFFWEDLVPFIDSEYNTNTGKRGLTGFSMGAYGAWWLMCHRPSEIAVIDTMSGAYLSYADPNGTSTFMNTVLGTRAANIQNWRDHDLETKINALVANGTTFPPRRLRVGNTGDVLAGSTEFSNYLTSKGITHSHVITAGAHDFQYWAGQINAIVTNVDAQFGTIATNPVGFAGAWTLLFEDDFDGTELDLAKWQPNWLGGSDSAITPAVSPGNDEAAYDPAQVTVSNGSCVLTTVASPVTVNGVTYPYRSGLINSNGHFNTVPLAGKPVVMEARINLQASSGDVIANFPAWWSNGQNWPTNGEIDIVEGLGGDANGHIHYPGGGPGTIDAPGDSTGWHVWSAKWTYQDKVEFAKDGVVYATITPRGTGYQTALSSPHYLILNLAVRSDIGGPDRIPGEMLIDYVRVWRAA